MNFLAGILIQFFVSTPARATDAQRNWYACKKDIDCVVFENGCGGFASINKKFKAAYNAWWAGVDHTTVQCSSDPEKQKAEEIKPSCVDRRCNFQPNLSAFGVTRPKPKLNTTAGAGASVTVSILSEKEDVFDRLSEESRAAILGCASWARNPINSKGIYSNPPRHFETTGALNLSNSEIKWEKTSEHFDKALNCIGSLANRFLKIDLNYKPTDPQITIKVDFR